MFGLPTVPLGNSFLMNMHLFPYESASFHMECIFMRRELPSGTVGRPNMSKGTYEKRPVR